MTFAERISDMIKKAATSVSEKKAILEIQRLTEWFFLLTEKPSMREFSDNLLMIAKNALFGDEEKTVVWTAMQKFPEALHHNALREYLLATGDEEIAEWFVERFFSHESNFDELKHDDPIVGDLKRALSVVTTMVPEQTVAFAQTALDMFPHLPAGADGAQGICGLVTRLANPPAPQPATNSRPKAADSIKPAKVEVKQTPKHPPQPARPKANEDGKQQPLRGNVMSAKLVAAGVGRPSVN